MERILTRWLDIPDLRKLDVYVGNGGYKALRKALFEMKPEEIINEVKNSNLRGRGGAAFPTGVKWSFIPKDSKKPVYLCCNADESEPGTFANRYELENDPHGIIEGIVIACRAVGAHTAYTYLRGEFTVQKRIFDAAVAEAYANDYLGKNILGSGFDLDIFTHRGAGAYICGEETGLLESLEGKRAYPRNRPPFPAIQGAVRMPDRRQQRRDAVERPAHHQSRRRLVQIDRPRKESRHRNFSASPATSTSRDCTNCRWAFR